MSRKKKLKIIIIVKGKVKERKGIERKAKKGSLKRKIND